VIVLLGLIWRASEKLVPIGPDRPRSQADCPLTAVGPRVHRRPVGGSIGTHPKNHVNAARGRAGAHIVKDEYQP